QCLTIANAATSPGAPLVQSPCNGGSNQQWSVSPSRSGYKLGSAHDALCASAAGASPGSRMVQQRCDEHASQTLYVS
ncbi:RICIN domain-containing protein, partial [Burkholderia pseudomallei]